jgi:hypothetical protein
MCRMLLLPPGVDAKHPEEYEHVERDGQRDQREDHPAVGANSKEPRVVDAVVDLELLRSTRENRELRGVGLGREAPLREEGHCRLALLVRERRKISRRDQDEEQEQQEEE